MATTSQRLVEGAKRSKETQAATTPLPTYVAEFQSVVTLLENFLRKCSMGYTLYPWISLLEPTLETSYKPQT